MRHDAAVWIGALGVLTVVVASCAAMATRSVYDRIHFLTLVTSIGGPLIGLGLVIQNGLQLASLQTGLIVVLLLISGAVQSAATGRLLAQNDGLVERGRQE